MKEGKEIWPLYCFFERLRGNDFPLGVTEYQLLLKALQVRYGLTRIGYEDMVRALNKNGRLSGETISFPKKELLGLCRLLWLKPGQNRQRFEELFELSWSLDFDWLLEKPVSAPPPPVTPGVTERTAPLSDSRRAQTVSEREEPYGKDSPGEEDDDQPLAVRIGFSQYALPENLDLIRDKTSDTEKSKFLFTSSYFPLDRRKMQQNIRLLNSFRATGSSREIDISDTIGRTVQNGLFDGVVWKKKKSNATHVLLLIDHYGSMVAFEQLAENIRFEMEKVLTKGNAPGSPVLRTFYFYNPVASYFFSDKRHSEAEGQDAVLSWIKSKRPHVIFVSDAGAADGSFNHQRIRGFRSLLEKIYKRSQKIAWLNPLPPERWKENSAQRIGEWAAMFEANETGIKNAIDYLKGTSLKVVSPL